MASKTEAVEQPVSVDSAPTNLPSHDDQVDESVQCTTRKHPLDMDSPQTNNSHNNKNSNKYNNTVNDKKKARRSAAPTSQDIRAMSAIKPEFYFEHGLRKIRPYHYVYRSFAKGRWLGYTVLELFKREFRGLSVEYYERAIKEGTITLNEQIVTCDTVIKNSDIIGHRMHRHEPPVTDEPVTIIEQTEDLWVINKPASIPVHPTGRYQHNTVLGILESTYPDIQLSPTNRLDRLTSGLMFIALTKQRAKQMEQAFRARKVQKEYVCRVLGNFHERVICHEPILTVSHKLGLNAVRPIEEGGRPCETEFERLSYNGCTSVVKCYPRTGRTHQIRVHLQHLGHPIANDPLYANPTIRKALAARSELNPTTATTTATTTTTTDHDNINDLVNNDKLKTDSETVAQLLQEADQRDGIADANAKDHCTICQLPLLPDPTPEQMCIWLHAAVYAGEIDNKPWRYETPLPSWATPEFDGDKEIVASIMANPQLDNSINTE
ncbi:pseudouridine synthase [Syncephalis fuscata]|nr:pseudouridine synthase [Syncephalis fuscata]